MQTGKKTHCFEIFLKHNTKIIFTPGKGAMEEGNKPKELNSTSLFTLEDEEMLKATSRGNPNSEI